MPDHICTSPQCQTTAGCKCNPAPMRNLEYYSRSASWALGQIGERDAVITALREENERLKAELAEARREALEEAIACVKSVANPDHDVYSLYVAMGPSGILGAACHAIRAAKEKKA